LDDSERMQQLIEDLKLLFERCNDITGTLERNLIRTGQDHTTERMIRRLERARENVKQTAEYLELILERSHPDSYLEWLMSIPADSEMFVERRIRNTDRKALS
jgi:hypothetical protein